MLRRIDKIINVGRFASFGQKASALKKLALIYARNGLGKTTICAVLRSAVKQDALLSTERRHLGAKDNSEATLTFDDLGVVSFQDAAWNRQPPSILTFDADYVRSNVHVAEEVTRDNKRQMLRVIVGEEGVSLAKRVDSLDEENTQLNLKIRNAEQMIRSAHPVITDVQKFVDAQVLKDAPDKLALSKRALMSAKRAYEIRTQPTLRLLAVPSSFSHIRKDLETSLATIGDDIEKRISDHLAKHNFDARGTNWLAYGAARAVHACPYCDQQLEHSQIAADLKEFFSKAYADLTQSLQSHLSSIQVIVGTSSDSLRETLLFNRAAYQFWTQTAEGVCYEDISDAELDSVSVTLQTLAEALAEKISSPFRAVALGDDLVDRLHQVCATFEHYNRQVSSSNQSIEEHRRLHAKDADADRVKKLEETVQRWVALLSKTEAAIAKQCSLWSEATNRKIALAGERLELQRSLARHVQMISQRSEDGVNNLLERFGTNFRMTQTKASYVGRNPNAEYCIDVNGYLLKVGEASNAEKPSFRTVLSAGDKSSLALALFLTHARHRSDLDKCILVFDDPFNSQDVARQFETSLMIRLLAVEAKQVILLSHDPRFLFTVYKDRGSIDLSLHQIVAESDWTASLRSWDVEDEIKTDYVRRAERIRHYAAIGLHAAQCTPTSLAADLRVFAEEFIDLRYPGRFPSRILLNEMLDSILDAGPNDALFAHVADLRSLNEFSRPDHHRGRTPPDPTELRAQCKKMVHIIGRH